MKWKFIVKRYLSVLFLEFICKGQSKEGMKREFDLDSGYDNYRCIEGDVSYTEKELDDFNRMVKSRFDKEKYRFFVSLLNKMNRLKESLMEAAIEVSKKDFSKFSDNELFDEFMRLAQKYSRFSVSLMAL